MADHDRILAAAVGEIHGQARPGQQAMADAVATALEGGPHLLVQAGTGTGKSLGYLAPALARCVETDSRVIVATGCETTLAKRLLEELGLPDVEVIGSELRAGWFGMRAHYHNYGPRKAQALARAGLAGWHVAYTDAAEDLPLLRSAAECAVLVNPAPKTRRRLERALGTRLRVVHWA